MKNVATPKTGKVIYVPGALDVDIYEGSTWTEFLQSYLAKHKAGRRSKQGRRKRKLARKDRKKGEKK